MNAVNSISNAIQNFKAALPADTKQKAIASGVSGLVFATAVTGGNIGVGIIFGTMSALASLVHAVTGVLFKNLFPETDPNKVGFWGEFARTAVTIGTTTLSFAVLGAAAAINELVLMGVIVSGIEMAYFDRLLPFAFKNEVDRPAYSYNESAVYIGPNIRLPENWCNMASKAWSWMTSSSESNNLCYAYPPIY